jgi:hypothetical protein
LKNFYIKIIQNAKAIIPFSNYAKKYNSYRAKDNFPELPHLYVIKTPNGSASSTEEYGIIDLDKLKK